MKLRDIKEGMKVKAVGSYADCIIKGTEYPVQKAANGELFIACKAGHHTLDRNMVYRKGDIPELEPT